MVDGYNGSEGAEGNGSTRTPPVSGKSGGSWTGKRGVLFTVLGGVVVLALLVTGGVFLLGDGAGDDGDKPQAGKTSPKGPGDVAKGFTADRKKLWSVQAKAKKGFDQVEDLVGSWLLKDAVVRADGIDVAAYGLKSGKKKWSVPKPSSDATPCGLTPTVNKKQQGGIVYETNGSGTCRILQVVDSRTGKVQWKKNLTKEFKKDRMQYSPRTGGIGKVNLMVNDGRMVVMARGGIIAYDLSGKERWSYSVRDHCFMRGIGKDSNIALREDCSGTDLDYSIFLLDAKSGKKKWSHQVRAGRHPLEITMLHVNPAVAHVKKLMDDHVHGFLVTFDPKGNPYKKIPVDHKFGELNIPTTPIDLSSTMLFKGTTMVTTATSDSEEYAPNNVVAFDLTTGRIRWKVLGESNKRGILLGLRGDYAVALANGRASYLVRYALSNGKKAKGGEIPLRDHSFDGPKVWLTGDKMIILPRGADRFGSSVIAYDAKR